MPSFVYLTIEIFLDILCFELETVTTYISSIDNSISSLLLFVVNKSVIVNVRFLQKKYFIKIYLLEDVCKFFCKWVRKWSDSRMDGEASSGNYGISLALLLILRLV